MSNQTFTAPVNGESNKLDVALIPTGMQLCTLYGLSDLGTQDGGQFGPKHRVGLMFEFPQELRVFYEGDQPKPCAIYTEQTLSMNEKANLRKNYVEPMIGRKLTDDEAASFDLSSLLGKHFVATITHSADGKYANISSITPLTEQNKLMFGLQTLSVPQQNPTFLFFLGQTFASENYKGLPSFIRSKLKESAEGKQHTMGGGTFNDPPQNQNGGNTAGAPTPNVRKIQMLPTAQFSYEQYKSSGWTDEQLVAQGHAKWQEPVAAPQPVASAAPAPAPSPTAAPAPAVAPTAPVQNAKHIDIAVDGKKVVMNDPNQTIKDWLAQGWTHQTLVDNGHATFQ